MYILIATVCIFALVLIAYIVYSKDGNVSNDKVINASDYSKGVHFKNADDMQRKFKEAYLWACDVFGVSENVYYGLESDCNKHPSLGVVFFTYYSVSHYPSMHHPYGLETHYKISDWDDVKQQTKFAKEFIENVNSVRYALDSEEIKLFKKYQISYKSLLTNKFEVNNMKLFSLPK